MDFIFSRDSPNFFTPDYTTVEKLGHAFHMHDVWLHSKEHYNEVRNHLPFHTLGGHCHQMWHADGEVLSDIFPAIFLWFHLFLEHEGGDTKQCHQMLHVGKIKRHVLAAPKII